MAAVSSSSPFEFGARCWCRLWILFYWFSTLAASGTLQIQQVLVPPQVMRGSNAVLRCLFVEIDSSSSTAPATSRKYSPVEHDPITGPLYSLKWYKGSHEFYRHLPRENPSTTVFNWTSQFTIEFDASEPGKVILRGVTAEAEGSYKCEVSSEGTFHTDFSEANLTVVDVQKEALILAQDPAVDEARVGDRFGWNCTFGQSRPSAHITWLVNGESVVPSSRYTITSSRASDDSSSKRLEWVDSLLEFTLAERHFRNQWLRVSCVVQIGSLFKKTKEISIRQQVGVAGRSAHHNPSAVVGPNGSRPSSNSGEYQPSMAKIAGSQRAHTNSVASVTGSSHGRMTSSFILLQAALMLRRRLAA